MSQEEEEFDNLLSSLENYDPAKWPHLPESCTMMAQKIPGQDFMGLALSEEHQKAFSGLPWQFPFHTVRQEAIRIMKSSIFSKGRLKATTFGGRYVSYSIDNLQTLIFFLALNRKYGNLTWADTYKEELQSLFGAAFKAIGKMGTLAGYDRAKGQADDLIKGLEKLRDDILRHLPQEPYFMGPVTHRLCKDDLDFVWEILWLHVPEAPDNAISKTTRELYKECWGRTVPLKTITSRMTRAIRIITEN